MHNTARNFALQLGALASLYLSLTFLIVLLFGIINVAFPDAAEMYWAIESAQNQIRMGIAVVVVFFPAYIILTRTVNRIRRIDNEGAYLTITKWLIYLSLLVGAGVLLGDLVSVIVTYLGGEITTRFLLKAAVVLLIVGAAFYYYLKDAQGYWIRHESKSVSFGLGAFAVVLVSVAYGLVVVDSPSEVRERRLDDRQVQDLQDIQFHIEDHIRTEDSLPESLAEVYVTDIPTAPEGREGYEYNLTEDGFELCATFAHTSEQGDDFSIARPFPTREMEAPFIDSYNWEHPAGRFCFERDIVFPSETPPPATE